MIEADDEGIDNPLNVTVVDEVPLGRVDLPLDADVEPEGMAVEPPAFMPIGKRRQLMGGFERKRFLQANSHGNGILGSPSSARQHSRFADGLPDSTITPTVPGKEINHG